MLLSVFPQPQGTADQKVEEIFQIVIIISVRKSTRFLDVAGDGDISKDGACNVF